MNQILRMFMPRRHKILIYNVPENLRIIDDHAGAFEVGIIVIREPVPDCFEEGRIYGFEDRCVFNIIQTEMSKYTWFNAA